MFIVMTFVYHILFNFIRNLLSVSLFARFKEEGSSFLPSYETFLQKSGSMSCEQVVQETLGENIQDPAFWKRAIESLNEPFTKLKALLD